MAQQVNISIKIAGKSIAPIADLDISQTLFTHNVIQVVIPLDAFKDNNSQILNQAKSFLNKPITAEIKPEDFNASSREFTFEGMVTDVRMARYQRGAKMIFVTAYSPTIHLSGVSNIRSFHEMTLADVVNQVIQDIPGGVTTKVDPGYTETIEYLVQYRETNMQFLQRLADTYGEWFFFDGDELIFGKLPVGNSIDLPLEKDLLDMKLSMRVVPVNYKAKAYDYLKHEIYQSTAQPSAVTDLDPFGKEILDQLEPSMYKGQSLRMPHRYFKNVNELDDEVTHEMATRAREMVVLSGTTDNLVLRVGSIIEVTGEKSNEVDLDKFIITSINHNIDENFSYTNTIEAIPSAAASPPDNPRVRIPFCEVQPATVVENDDEKGMGRVKLRLKWMEDSQMTPWVRVVQPYAGQASQLHGFFFTPEIDDEILVGFVNDNPDLPFVMGSVYRHHDSHHPSEWHDPETKRKVIKTRNGNQIHFIDDNGREEIIISNKDIKDATNEIRLSMEGDGKITIKTLGELDIKAQSIRMESEQDIDIKAGASTSLDVQDQLKISSSSNTELKAQEMKIDAGPAFDLNATESKIDSSTVSIKGSGQVEMEGSQTSIKGSGKLDIEGAQTTVKGSGMLNLEGGGTASLKAGMVKIN